MTVADGIAIAALVIALWSAWKTDRFNKRQQAFEETAERLNLLLIEREAADTKAQRAADVSANFYQAGKNDYRLKVFNRGKGVARNVQFEVLDKGDLFIESEVASKFPMPSMEQHMSIELIGYIHFGSPRRTHIRLTWDDDTGEGHQKELHPTW